MLAQGRVRPKMQAVKFHEETLELSVGALINRIGFYRVSLLV